jgi:hypothetical protein
MRPIIAAVAVAALSAGVACAQYKTPTAATPPKTGGTVQIPTTPAGSPVQITPGSPNSPVVQSSSTKTEEARRIKPEDAIKMVKEKKAVYVDVRSKESYDAEHIKGAISIPLSELQARFRDLPVGKFIITYCA